MRRLTLIPLVIIFSVLFIALSAASSFAITPSVEDAVLKGDWKTVSEIIEKDDSQASDPVARFIMAHACLATNRNNASLLLFLSAKEEGNLKSWSEWTDSLLKKNPQNPLALYLSADAKARQGSLDEAKGLLNQALQIKRDFALALNARGVVRVLTNDWDNALIDFIQATEPDPKLADAFANLGTFWIVREAADGALEAFNKAIEINPDFALAYNGRGCAYFGKGEFENAAQDFGMASQLSPVLVGAEINQGYATAYASKLITMASLEKKPGTTLESVIKQYPDVLKEQQQQLLKMLPSQKDQEFWKKMDALPWILQSDEKTQSLVKEYGLQRVQVGAFLKMQEYKDQIAETNQKVQTLYNKINSYDQKIWNLQGAEFVTSLGFSAMGTRNDLQKGWDYAQLKTELKMEKSVLSSGAPNPYLKTVIDAIPTSLTPQSLAASIASSVFKTGRAVLEDKRDAARIEFETLASQVPVRGAQLRAIETNLNRLGGTSIVQPTTKSSGQIPGYYTGTDRPLTELGALASMADKGIKTPSGSPRSALIVSQDPFRTNLLQSELNKYGFQTKVIPLGADPQIAAKQWGADVILGIKGSPEIKGTQIGQIPVEDPSRKFYDDVRKKLPPPFPPDKGGGAAGIPKLTQPPIQQNWDWGKSFVPTYPKGGPGGISTEELARAFVDKGNWPVMTSFSLFYQVQGQPKMEAK